MAQLTERGAGLTAKEAQLIVKGAEVKESAVAAGVALDERETGALEQTGALDEILAQFMADADEAIGNINDRKPSGGTVRREGGRLTADVEFDDGSTKSISAVREKGGLKIVPVSQE
jgi:hypothetical protein